MDKRIVKITVTFDCKKNPDLFRAVFYYEDMSFKRFKYEIDDFNYVCGPHDSKRRYKELTKKYKISRKTLRMLDDAYEEGMVPLE